MENIQAIKELMYDIDNASKGKSANFSTVQDLDKAMQNALVEFFGSQDITTYQIATHPNRQAFYNVVTEFLRDTLPVSLTEAMPFMEQRNIAWGDEANFIVENPDLFQVVTTATGNGVVKRQRIEDGLVTVTTQAKAIRIFENFKRAISGRARWSEMIAKVRDSYIQYVKELVLTALYASTPVNASATFNVHDSGGFSMASLRTLRDNVQAGNQGADVYYVGTRTAVAELAPITGKASQEANDDFYKQGYYTTAEGDRVVPLSPLHKANTFDMLLSNKQIFVMPVGASGMVKHVTQGTPLFFNKEIGANADMSVEFLMYVEDGAAVVTTTRYGKYTWA